MSGNRVDRREGGLHRGEPAQKEYGARKVWRHLEGERIEVPRCTVERLVSRLDLCGAVRGKAFKTTLAAAGVKRPADLVQRQFVATPPNQLWVADFTYVATWAGFVFVALVIDVYTRCIVGWRVSGVGCRRRCAPTSCWIHSSWHSIRASHGPADPSQ